jgi:hypothetical protein
MVQRITALAIQSNIRDLILDRFAEFTPDSDPGLAMAVAPLS